MVLLWDWKVWRSSNSRLLSCPEMECLVKLKEPGNCKTLTITFHVILVVRDWTDYIKLSSITSAIKMSPQVTASRSLGLGTLALQRSRSRALWAVCSRQGLHNSCEVMWQSTVFSTDALCSIQLYVFIITFSAYIILDESFYILCLPCTNRFSYFLVFEGVWHLCALPTKCGRGAGTFLWNQNSNSSLLRFAQKHRREHGSWSFCLLQEMSLMFCVFLNTSLYYPV